MQNLSDENIKFWQSCEQYKNKFKNRLNKDERKKEAKSIFNEFFKSERINIESETKSEVQKNLSNPTEKLFDKAQKEVM